MSWLGNVAAGAGWQHWFLNNNDELRYNACIRKLGKDLTQSQHRQNWNSHIRQRKQFHVGRIWTLRFLQESRIFHSKITQRRIRSDSFKVENSHISGEDNYKWKLPVLPSIQEKCLCGFYKVVSTWVSLESIPQRAAAPGKVQILLLPTPLFYSWDIKSVFWKQILSEIK